MKRRIVLVAGIAVVVLALIIAGVVYTNIVQRQAEQRYQELLHKSEQQWCTLIGTLDEAYQVNPPTTPLGQRLATQMHLLYGSFGCLSVAEVSK